MSDQDVFDAFYRETRADVHLQAFLLTGDLTAATAAVKDAYALTWARWKKVSARQAKGAQEPLAHVRELAWRLAQRRHTGRIWHRNKGLTDDDKRVLDTVHKLATGHRRAVLLVDLAGVPVEQAAPELAVTRAVAESRLDEARAELAAALGPDYLEQLRGLGVAAGQAKLPRPSIVLRAGRERRRLTTVASVAGAIALTIGVGAAAREPGLERASGVHQVMPGGKPVGQQLPDGIDLTTPEQLLEASEIGTLTPQQAWEVKRTDNNTKGDGLNTICQLTRYADPRGIAGLIRTYNTTSTPTHTALQTVEISKDAKAATAAYTTTMQWFAGCREARLQLVGAYQVDGVGDQADLITVRVGGRPTATYDVAIARVEEITTTLVSMTPGPNPADPQLLATALSEAVSKLCPSDNDGCSGPPTLAAVPPPPSGEEAGFVSTVDLPPVGTLSQPWVGVESVNALQQGDTMTRCDQANYRKAKAVEARARTFLIPGAKLPATFGFTETVGTFDTPKRARGFLAGIRTSVEGCEERDLTTEVSEEFTEAKGGYDLSVWRFDSKISEDESVVFRVGFVRVGNRVAKLTFVPQGKQDMQPAAFQSLVRRAGDRLRELAGA